MATRMVTTTITLRIFFQYPQRVVVDGNPVAQIERTGLHGFQYPQRVVVDGNPTNEAQKRRKLLLSVPSAGRSGWQPPAPDGEPLPKTHLSVPSAGRSGWQPSSPTGALTTKQTFSTLSGS